MSELIQYFYTKSSKKYRISIKIKISMTCVYKEYEVKNGTGAMTTAKKFL